jgi:hypothetical protein
MRLIRRCIVLSPVPSPFLRIGPRLRIGPGRGNCAFVWQSPRGGPVGESPEPYRYRLAICPSIQAAARPRVNGQTWQQLYDPVLPGIFIAWARRTDIEVAAELVEAVQKRGL